MARVNRQTFTTEFPNLFLATTYALNKSDSKRVCVGLEHTNGYFHQVVKLVNCSSKGYNKIVTLDHQSWECLKDQFGTIQAYFTDSYEFYHDHGRPNKIYLPHHDLAFTSSYGTKSISLDERPQPGAEITAAPMNHSTNNDEPPCKKMGMAPPGIVMQLPTFDGLRKQGLLISLALDELKAYVGKVNRTLDIINEYLQSKMQKEGAEQDNRIILADLKAFHGFYRVLNADIDAYVSEKLENDRINYVDGKLKFFLAEIVAFGLPIIMNDLRNSLNVEK